ncbi:MAG: cyclopropane-fatty-acyl-phospholipid synthase family protein [Pseudomonadota bacterium]
MNEQNSPTEVAPLVVTSQNFDQALQATSIFFKLACRIVLRMKYGSVIFHLPDGRILKFEGETETDETSILLVCNFDFARRVFFKGDIGFFESFADGEWETPDLAQCLFVFAKNAEHITDFFESAPFFGWLDRLRHTMNRNTKSGSKRNIMAHYDLGNAFYEQWLDRTMTYSSARFDRDGMDLASAQASKYRALAETMSLKPDETVLEIGSGWGGFAEYAAKDIGAKVTGLTISQAQLEFAQERIFREGLNERVEFRLQDYRDATGEYDKIASIEMFEAVGKEYWPAYFDKLRQCLKPNGVAGLQIITIDDRYFDHYQARPDFIQRYVFPGGMLPSIPILKKQIESAGLLWRDASAFGQDYAKTLHAWMDRFLYAWDDIAPMGFDDQFKKLWRFYLAYCEAGFRAKTTDVIQVAVTR